MKPANLFCVQKVLGFLRSLFEVVPFLTLESIFLIKHFASLIVLNVVVLFEKGDYIPLSIAAEAVEQALAHIDGKTCRVVFMKGTFHLHFVLSVGL